MVITLHTHVFCIEQFDNDHIICGQMNGWIDLVNIDTGFFGASWKINETTKSGFQR